MDDTGDDGALRGRLAVMRGGFAALTVLTVALAACGGSQPNAAACRTAIRAEIKAAVKAFTDASGNPGAGVMSERAACQGLSKPELLKLYRQALGVP